MDPVSMGGTNYAQAILTQSRQSQGQALISLLDVLNQATTAAARPLANISGKGLHIDVMA